VLIHHLALESDWEQAKQTGSYTTSTLGQTLDEVGFIHASRAEQVKQVSDGFYRSVRKPLVRLDIATDRLTSAWREDPVDGDSYPHIYGPLNLEAVTAVVPWHRTGRPKSLLEVLLNEAFFRIGLLLLVIALSFVGAFLGQRYDESDGGWIGALAGLGAGGVLAVLVMRRRA